ncbi:hypothetical protein GIW45_23305 [Pseudomonas congelans]|uniref:DNA cytosine methyltransferase n=1 Tax=Pseudomonas congelans TaxID=200452 RepID=UPI001F3DBDBB|nr:DNA cytosine methyltransferase [Pseudomonas congelans]MCF5166917.1 hypothetical protein [Pseudomonas congelans]
MKPEFSNDEYVGANFYSVDEKGYSPLIVKSAANLQKLRALDLFAGAGGFSLAAQRSGIEVVAAVELNEHACKNLVLIKH